MTGPEGTLDARGEARQALTSVVKDYGIRVLSNPPLLSNLFKDLLPGSPREANLLVAAAEGGAPTMLEQQVAGVGPDSAVRSIAANLAQERSLDPSASVWAVAEFARAMGYPVSDSVRAMPPPPAGPPAWAGPAAAAAAGAGLAEAGDLTAPLAAWPPATSAAPGAAASSGPRSGSPGSGYGPPTGAPAQPPPGQWGPPGGPAPAAAPPPGQWGAPGAGPPASGGPPSGGGPPFGPPPGMGAGGQQPPWGGGGATPPGPTPKGRGGLVALIAAAVVVVVIGGYLGVAAAAHLAPFGKKATPTPIAFSPTARPTVTPSPSPSPTGAATAGDLFEWSSPSSSGGTVDAFNLGDQFSFSGCSSASYAITLGLTDPTYDAVAVAISCLSSTPPDPSALYSDFHDGDYFLTGTTCSSLSACLPSYATSNGTCSSEPQSDYVDGDVSGEELCDFSSNQNTSEDYILFAGFNTASEQQTYYSSLLSLNGMSASQGTCSTDDFGGSADGNAQYCENPYTMSSS